MIAECRYGNDGGDPASVCTEIHHYLGGGGGKGEGEGRKEREGGEGGEGRRGRGEGEGKGEGGEKLLGFHSIEIPEYNITVY